MNTDTPQHKPSVSDRIESVKRVELKDFNEYDIPGEWKKELEEMSNLPPGWDGYDGQPITQDILEATKNILLVIHKKNMPKLHIMPGGDNTVMLEFNDLEIEIHIKKPDSVTVEYSGRTFAIGSDYSFLGSHLDEASKIEKSSVNCHDNSLYSNSPDYEFQVIRKPGTRSGIPIVKGTRFGVYEIAAIAKKMSVDDILKSYPSLNRDMVEKSVKYAEVNSGVKIRA